MPRRLRLFRKREEPSESRSVDPVAIIRQARRLRFRVRPTATLALAGAYHGARPGTGLTFAELKPYEPGDDVRHLDWNVTARQGRPFVRQFVEERSLSLWLIVDISASLRFGPSGRSKADRAAQAAALLAAAAVQNGDRVGLTLVTDRVEAELPPAGGTRQLSRLLRMLVASTASSRATQLSAGLPEPHRFLRRGLVVVLSDFLTLEPTGPWRRLSKRADLIAIRIVDPLEEQLPDAGLVCLQDAETGLRRTIDTSNRRLRLAYAAAAAQRRRNFHAWCASAHVSRIELLTTNDPIVPLLQFFRARGERSRFRP